MTHSVGGGSAHYLLDTNIVSFLVDNRSPHNNAVWEHIERAGPSASFFVSILTLYEMGSAAPALGLQQALLMDDLERHFGAEGPLPLPLEGVDSFVALKSGLAKTLGVSVRSLAKHNVDLMIATTALIEDLTLVSHDGLFRTLARIEPALRVEDWTEP